MGLLLTALVSTMGKIEQPTSLTISTFGVWNEEISTSSASREQELSLLRAKLRGMNKAHKGKLKPFTLSWLPSEDNKLFFTHQRSKKLQILIYIEKPDKSANWKLLFENVQLNGNPVAENRNVAGMNNPIAYERIQFAYLKFTDSPN